MFIISLKALELGRYQPSALLSTFLSVNTPPLQIPLQCYTWATPTANRWAFMAMHSSYTYPMALSAFFLLTPSGLCLRPQAQEPKLTTTSFLPSYRL